MILARKVKIKSADRNIVTCGSLSECSKRCLSILDGAFPAQQQTPIFHRQKPVDAASVRNNTMKHNVFAVLVGTAALGAATIAAAQSTTPATTGSYSSMNVGAAPIHGLDGPAFSAAASDANGFQIAASRLSLTRSQRSDVKDYARRIISESQTSQQTLMASLSNDQRKIARPSTRLSAERASMLKMLRSTPRGSFDNLYLTQSAQVQQGNWATYKGYAEDGADQSLKQVAGNGVPIIEQQLQQGSALLPSSLSAN
jgi:predicted outer membrane protein